MRVNIHRRVEVPLWRSYPPLTESNCVVVTRGGEQLEVNGQSAELWPNSGLRHELGYGLMRLMRLRPLSEVRRTADSETKRIGGQACPERRALPEDRGAWGGWRRNVWKCMFVNQGCLCWCRKGQDRSQSPHSSIEAGNDRGAKGDRKVEA